MIEITIPNYEYDLLHSEIDLLPKKPGVYILFNEKGKALYVGMTTNLQKRILEHFYNRISNIYKFRGQFHRVKAFTENEYLNRRIYEIYLIHHFQTDLNIAGKDLSKPKDKPNSTRCKFIKSDDSRCKKQAHTNGYCGTHGGNGRSMHTMIHEAIVKYHEIMESETDESESI
jgi:hypothetical protein